MGLDGESAVVKCVPHLACLPFGGTSMSGHRSVMLNETRAATVIYISFPFDWFVPPFPRSFVPQAA